MEHLGVSNYDIVPKFKYKLISVGETDDLRNILLLGGKNYLLANNISYHFV